MEPMHYEYVLQAVSNPKLTSINSFFKSPSIVLGTPTTLIYDFWLKKYSANKAALVLDPSPPITTNPSSLSDSQYLSAFLDC
jgi:hypothetical protein